MMKKRDWERTDDDLKNLAAILKTMPFFAGVAPAERKQLYKHCNYLSMLPGSRALIPIEKI